MRLLIAEVVLGAVMFQYVAAPFHSQRVLLGDLVRVERVEGGRDEGGR